MAIYKPSNCEPFLERLDLTEDYTGSFVINTNNVAVNGYKLRILDGGNNLVFEGAKFQKINAAGVAYNGDRVTIPIIKKITDKSYASEFNVIYYFNGVYYYKDSDSILQKIVNFKNGYAVQPYKWQVILAQGLLDDKGNLVQQPIEDKYYDMTIASGTVLGSTPNRIQGKLSEEIYKDYFIQLCDSNGKDVSNRVLIDSYDHTYGYIYPQKGEFTQDDINNSMYFKIYKNTNNIKYINTNRIVDYKTGYAMESIKFDGSVLNSVPWGVSSDGTFFYQKYNDVVRVEGTTGKKVNVKIPVSSYTGTTIAGSFVSGKTTLLVTEETDAGEATRLSKYNGVFLFVSAVWEESETDVNKGTVTVTWMRPAMADTWAEFLGQSFYVVANGSNWDSNATSSGVINSTPLSFKEEAPIVIYPNEDGDNKTRGVIYKTNEYVEDSGNTERRVYIRPFVGIESGMRFQYLKDGKTGYMDNITIDTERWCVEYVPREGSSIEFTPDVDTYSIVSFFKYSDENPFYGYSNPTISIKKINDVAFTDDDMIISARSIHVVGECSQTWKSFQWKLLDYNYNTVQYGEVKYDGEISADFIGLENEHYYEITLIIEDEFGDVFSVSGDFQVGNIDFENPFEEALQEKLNCELHSVDVSLAGNFGVVEPGVVNEKPINQYYKDVKIGSKDLPIIGGLSEPTNGDITFNFETKITDPNFEGDIIGLEIGEELQATSEINKSGTNDVISFVIPPLTVEKNGKRVVNDKRYQVQLYRKIQDSLSGSISNGSAEPITIIKDGKEEKNWSDIKGACYAYNDKEYIKSDNCDYIDFEAWPDGKLNLKFDINGKEYNFKERLDQWSKTLDQWSQIEAATGKENEVPGVWYDKKTELIKQPDGSEILVETDEDNLLPENEDAVWSDYGYEPYILTKVKDATTGREALTDYTINVNMAYKNYVYKPTAYTECVIRCEFIKNEDNK